MHDDSSLEHLVQLFRRLLADKTNIMEWYSGKARHLLSTIHNQESERPEGSQLSFHPKINARSRKEHGEYLARQLSEKGTIAALPVSQHSSPLRRSLLLYEHGKHL